MPYRNLTLEELSHANALLKSIRDQLHTLAGHEKPLLFAYRRKIAKELSYDERGKPAHRKLLKALKRGKQNGLCALCAEPLADKYMILDRLEGMGEYIESNTRLVCVSCDTKVQHERGYR